MELGSGKMRNGPTQRQFRSFNPAAAIMVLAGLLVFSGCVGFASQLLYTFKGHRAKAAYEGLEGKRVAVIAVSSSAFYDPQDPTGEVARKVSKLLEINVKDIEIVDEGEIADWIDQNDWQMRYKKVGIGVKADRVVAIEFSNLSFRDSSTLVKGRSDFTVSVVDVHSGKRVFHDSMIEHEHPRNSPADRSPKVFRAEYTSVLATLIAHYFFDHPIDELFANDARGL
jgi:hypothetical protein